MLSNPGINPVYPLPISLPYLHHLIGSRHDQAVPWMAVLI